MRFCFAHYDEVEEVLCMPHNLSKQSDSVWACVRKGVGVLRMLRVIAGLEGGNLEGILMVSRQAYNLSALHSHSRNAVCRSAKCEVPSCLLHEIDEEQSTSIRMMALYRIVVGCL